MVRIVRIRRWLLLCCSVVLTLVIHTYPHLRKECHKPEIKELQPYPQSEAIKFFLLQPDPFVNLHAYTFQLTTTVCAKDKYHVVMVVHSSPFNYQRRKRLRETYGSVKHYNGKHLAMVFMIGVVVNISLQKTLMKESDKFGDIVQANFLDSYKNISMKHIMAMHWFRDNCKADFIMKLDDDTFVNPYRLVDFLNPLVYSNVIYCKLFSEDPPNRNPKSKWFTPIYEYPFETFPPYCLGFAYITTPSVWRTLYKKSVAYRTMGMDDVFVTGVLAAMGGVKHIDISDVMSNCTEHLEKFNVNAFRKAVILIDPLENCTDLVFQHWGDLDPGPVSRGAVSDQRLTNVVV